MPEDIYNVNFEDVEKTAREHGRIAIHVLGHCVIIMDDHIIGDGFIRQFEDSPHGYNQARRWAIRLVDEDIDSAQTLQEIEAQHNKDLGFD